MVLNRNLGDVSCASRGAFPATRLFLSIVARKPGRTKRRSTNPAIRFRDFARCSRAAMAVEFALVSTMLIPMILFILIVGFILYLNQVLDYATNKAARQIMIGAVQKGGVTQSAFQTQLCSYLSAAFNCANVIVNVQTTNEITSVQASSQTGGYYAFVNSNQTGLIIPTLSNGSAQFSPGLQGSYEYVQVIYPITIFPQMFAGLFGTATYQGSSAYLAVSTAAFRNEQY